ncbi:hypothetical protein F2P81_009577 [Scophthalmus maximus]|uniref:Uncharacterized protein n=1 Tax=Scophthalmus maximus TaxID=52904 RepID=A0A6A4SZ45_SCOMX|nr:hypothetical protein F2P81_009577 [Scophthalmus maximus]
MTATSFLSVVSPFGRRHSAFTTISVPSPGPSLISRDRYVSVASAIAKHKLRSDTHGKKRGLHVKIANVLNCRSRHRPEFFMSENSYSAADVHIQYIQGG